MATVILTDTGGRMNDNSTVVLSALAIVGSSLTALIFIAKYLLVDQKKSTDRNTKAQEAVAKALQQLAKSTDKNTIATISADTYLKERNGRDNEQHGKNIKIQNTMVTEMKKIPEIIFSTQQQRHAESKAVLEATQAIPETLKQIAKEQAIAIIKAVSVKEQKVEHQEIAHMHIDQATKDKLTK